MFECLISANKNFCHLQRKFKHIGHLTFRLGKYTIVYIYIYRLLVYEGSEIFTKFVAWI